MKKTGFTLIELLSVIVIIAVILAVAIPSISGVIKGSTRGAFASDAKMLLKAIDYQNLKDDTFNATTINKDNIESLLGIDGDNYESVSIAIENNVKTVTIVGTGKWDGLVACGNYQNMLVVSSTADCNSDLIPPIITLLGENPVSLYVGGIYSDASATALDNKDGDLTSSINVTSDVNTSVVGTYTVTYTVTDAGDNQTVLTRTVYVEHTSYSILEKVNKPKLVTGMTPVKWNGSAWVVTTEADADWYNYTDTDKKWANARTADGSMWVWIPRYAYKINSEYHSNVTGTIDVKFLKGPSDITVDGNAVATTPTYSGSVQTNYAAHPAFDFGTTELTGLWVAKFEPSFAETSDLCYTTETITNCNKTTLTTKIVPNARSWRGATIGNSFTIVRGMEINSVYGWGTTGVGIDTHQMKNTEWGVIAYLSKSKYGKENEEVWINNSSTYTTGCAGNSTSEPAYSGCQNTYETVNGVKASTTGTIYGIYDLSGGGHERTSSYINNGDSYITSNGGSIVSADAKYRDVYTVTTDDQQNNYANASSKFGDAIYETSNSYLNATAWFSDNTVMSFTTSPFFVRGGGYDLASASGMFFFSRSNGGGNLIFTFRPILVVDTGS